MSNIIKTFALAMISQKGAGYLLDMLKIQPGTAQQVLASIVIFYALNYIIGKFLPSGQANADFLRNPVPRIDGLKFIRGQQIEVGRKFNRKAVIVAEFWATWCPPCVKSIPHLSVLAKKFSHRDIYFVGITDETDEAKVTAFVKDMGDRMDYSVALDTKFEAKRKIFGPSGGQGIPHAVIIGVDNEVVWTGHPMDPKFEEHLQQQALVASERTKEPLVALEDDVVEPSGAKNETIADDEDTRPLMECKDGWLGIILSFHQMSINGTPLPPITGLKFVKGDDWVTKPLDPSRRVVRVFEFWATWCGPCRSTIPHLSELANKYIKKDVYIVGVTDEKDEGKIRGFVEGMGKKMDYPVALDLELSARKSLFIPSGAQGIPHVILVGVDGKVLWNGHPVDPQFAQLLEQQATLATDREPEKEPEPLPLITESEEELGRKSVKELKAILSERGIGFGDCFEKGDLVKRVRERAATVQYYKS
ncbi:hypothetical protein HK101_001862 [Irineochytrium annulatum]|nr:hypothetical protein HK101_001862 [Irineochytrium annulatum]